MRHPGPATTAAPPLLRRKTAMSNSRQTSLRTSAASFEDRPSTTIGRWDFPEPQGLGGLLCGLGLVQEGLVQRQVLRRRRQRQVQISHDSKDDSPQSNPGGSRPLSPPAASGGT